jgi:phosphoglycolate phosphatase-like HAD superfamily hydrolase
MPEQACYIFDIDGTLADATHRLPHIQKRSKDWDSFFAECVNDAPIPHIVELAKSLPLPVVCVSGRSDVVRAETDFWLRVKAGLMPAALYMRKAGDRRDDSLIKIEMLEELRADGWRPVMAFDDRDRVVAAWREAGIPCAQVAPGDF